MKYRLKFKQYVPLIVIFGFIGVLTISFAWMRGDFSPTSLMLDLMAWWFVVFASFKLARLRGFAQAYSLYDLVAMKFPGYGYVYPFIELGLGLMFLFRFSVVAAAWLTLVLMSVNSIGAYKGVRDKKVIMCACMGTVFRLPMSFVSLGEDVFMVIMAAVLLFMHYA